MTKKQTSRRLKSTDSLSDTLQLLWGFVPGRAIETAFEAGFFELFGLEGTDRISQNTVCERLNWNVHGATVIIRLFERLSLVKVCGDGAIELTMQSIKCLREAGVYTLASYLKRRHRLELAYEQLAISLRTGAPNEMMSTETRAAFGLNRQATAEFVEAMRMSAEKFGPDLIHRLNSTRTIENPFKILDVGCGPATLSVLLARQFPLSVIHAFDLSGVSEWARSTVVRAGLERRIQVSSSDWNSWPWRYDAYDLVLLSQVLHEVPEDEASTLFRRACESLSAGGRVCVVLVGDGVGSPTGDLLHAVFSLNMLIETGGTNPTRQMLRDWGNRNRVREVTHALLPGGRSVWIGAKSIPGKRRASVKTAAAETVHGDAVPLT